MLVLRFAGVLFDRAFALCFVYFLLSLFDVLTVKNFVVAFFVFDALYYSVFRWIAGETAGDVLFGVFWETGRARPLKLFLRWLLGYLSAFFVFLPHITALSGQKSLCDSISGVTAKENTEKIEKGEKMQIF